MFDDRIILASAAIVAAFILAAAVVWLKRGPRGEIILGILWRLVRVFCRVVHRARMNGLESLRDQQHSGPLIIVSNHTGAVDPLLIQGGCRFPIRWLMASDMMTPLLNRLWRHVTVIPVDRDGRDLVAAREAIRHVLAGGAIGIFPEGGIVVPPRQLRPFHPGVGLIVARTRAPVMLVWVSGTSEHANPTPLKSILTPSHAKVEFIELMDFKGERDAAAITKALRQRIAAVSGWPLND
jgi:1-acyl-sn-glycerol-3-phosphate acyltransferase